MSMQEADSYISAFDATLKEFDLDLQSKSSSRLLTSTVWIQDKLENRLNRQLKPLLTSLDRLRSEARDSGIESNLTMSIKHTQQLIKLTEDLLMTYRQAASITDMKIKWAHNLQKMKEEYTHLKNRFTIIKGMKEREKDVRNFLPF